MSQIPKDIFKKHIKKEFPNVELVNVKEVNYLMFFKMKSQKKKTFDVLVCSVSSGAPLCLISWYGAWHQYVMKSVEAETNQIIFNKGCLNDIIAYIDDLMEARKNK